jgi:hypothetical protein
VSVFLGEDQVQLFSVLPKVVPDPTYSTQSELDHIAWLLNTRPRKRYDFKSPQHMMERELEGGLISVALDS